MSASKHRPPMPFHCQKKTNKAVKCGDISFVHTITEAKQYAGLGRAEPGLDPGRWIFQRGHLTYVPPLCTNEDNSNNNMFNWGIVALKTDAEIEEQTQAVNEWTLWSYLGLQIARHCKCVSVCIVCIDRLRLLGLGNNMPETSLTLCV